MLKIKLVPFGKKHGRKFRIAVVEENSKITGKVTEYLGYFHPQRKELSLNKERLDYWVDHGAQPTEGFRKILKN
jgi:small subunit ribosomal protein S16